MSKLLEESYVEFLTKMADINKSLIDKHSKNKTIPLTGTLDVIQKDINELRSNSIRNSLLIIPSSEEISFVNFIAESKIALEKNKLEDEQNTIILIRNLLLKTNLYLELHTKGWQEINKKNPNASNDLGSIVEGEINRLRSFNNTAKLEIENIQIQNAARAREFEDIVESFKNDVNNLKKENAQLFSELQLIRQQANFYDVAKDAKKIGNNWVWGIAISIVAIIVFSCIFSKSFLCDFDDYYNTRTAFFQSQEKNIFYIEIAKRLVFKALIITILLALLRFSIKNFNAARHSYTVNMHKSSCFGAVYDISRAIIDEPTRSTLTNLAGKEIFTQSKSGYLSNEETKLDLKFLEKVGAVFNKKSEDV